MKILSIASKIPIPANDGGKLSIFGVLKSLSQLGHQIDFVAYRKDTPKKFALEELSKYCIPHILDVQTENNYLDMLKNMFSSIPYNISKYHRIKLQNFIEEYFEKSSPDIIHVTSLHMGWIIDVIKKISNVPVVLRQENLEMTIMKRFSESQSNPFIKWYSKKQYKKFITYEPELCAKFDKCIMITDKDAGELKRLNPKVNTTSIPVGIDKKLLELKKVNEEKFTLAHIGHLDWYPNFDSLNWFLKDIFPLVIKRIPQTKLYVYGGGTPKGFRIPESLKKNVIIEGFVSDLWSELLTKSLAIVPLRIGSGLRVKILEMLAAGQNIITTSIGKEGINVYDKKEVLISDDALHFANKIIDFFQDKYNADQMIKNGKRLISEQYTWDIIGKKFENIYQELLNERQ